jgi:hypothetical protein
MTARRDIDYDREFDRCRDYLYWRFKGDYCLSFDKERGKQHMPDKAYNLLICKMLANDSIRHVAIPKTRQMLMTWEASAFCVHYAMFNPGAEILVVNKKGDDSAYIVYRGAQHTKKKTETGEYTGRGRCWSIYNNQPSWLKERVPASPAANLITFGNSAFIGGLPEGEEQLHQYQASIVWFDEASRQSDFGDRYEAAVPMAKRILITSTPKGQEDFYRLCKDVQKETTGTYGGLH